MTWRVRIVPDVLVDGIALQIANRSSADLRQQLIFDSGTLEAVEPGTAMPRPSLTLDDELGRALLDALAEHYGHTSGGRRQQALERIEGKLDKLLNREHGDAPDTGRRSNA